MYKIITGCVLPRVRDWERKWDQNLPKWYLHQKCIAQETKFESTNQPTNLQVTDKSGQVPLIYWIDIVLNV